MAEGRKAAVRTGRAWRSAGTGRRLWDISPRIEPSLKVWPGDTPLSREVLRDMAKGHNLTLSTLHATVHLGAHADAPSHYARDGKPIDQRSLDYYLGSCQVVHAAVGKGEVLRPSDLKGPIRAERVLFHTGTFDPQAFNEDFAAFSPELVDFLHSKKVKLAGIDTPSADPFHSKDLPSHKRLHTHDMAVLEGLVLDEAPEGLYELIALPLRLAGFDASPVRAVLRALR